MSRKSNCGYFSPCIRGCLIIGLPALSLSILVLEHYTHQEFLLHVAAIPLEILFGGYLFERFMANKEKAVRLRQLMYLKSYIFRSEMKRLFISNFQALKTPVISMAVIKDATPAVLRELRSQAEDPEYRSVVDMEKVIMEYVSCHDAFAHLMDRAIANDLEDIFEDMVMLLHFIQDVKFFKREHPDRSFAEMAMQQTELKQRMQQVLRHGIHVFLDFVIELKVKQPRAFDHLLTEYQLSYDSSSVHGLQEGD